MILTKGIPTQKLPLITDSEAEKSLNISVKRLDLIHPRAGGNKYFKLLTNFRYALENNFKQIITFGGPYSNHIAATAFAGKENDIETIGIIRGEEPKKWSKTLREAFRDGMKLQFVSRSEYLNKNSQLWQNALLETHGYSFIIPEGGSNEFGVQGCESILTTSDVHYQYIVVACGTGGTISGIIRSANPDQEVIGVPVLNAIPSIRETIENFTKDYTPRNWNLISGYSFGGYAKSNDQLENFLRYFSNNTGIPVEKVYTGKLFFALTDMITSGYFKENSNILVIHTGGLQYIES